MMEPLLRVGNIFAGYGDVDVLRGASVTLSAGEFVAILGPNGAGKSTLLKVIMGLVRPRSGRVELAGKDLLGLPTETVVAAGVAYVPQVANVFPNLTVLENLEMGAFLRSGDIREAIGRVHHVFPVLATRAKDRVSRLSGGQRQMVAIGRALMSSPRVLLLDEPTAGLAPDLQDQVLDRAKAITRAGVPVMLVEQNAKKALARADRAYIFDQGRNKHEDTGAALLADERLGHLYLGGRPPTP